MEYMLYYMECMLYYIECMLYYIECMLYYIEYILSGNPSPPPPSLCRSAVALRV